MRPYTTTARGWTWELSLGHLGELGHRSQSLRTGCRDPFFPVKSYHPFRPGKHVPFICRNGTLVDLNTLVSSNPGFTVTDSVGINDLGQILCNATNSSGVQRAVMLTPK
jgi:hypothetical protein